MYQSSTAIPTLQGPNVAPLVDQSKIETPGLCKPFPEFIKELTTKLERLDREIWDEMHIRYLVNNMFIEGNHMLQKRNRGFGFDVIPMPATTMASVREQNKLGFYSRSLMAKHVASRTKVEAVSLDDSEEGEEIARSAEHHLEDLQRDIYCEEFRQREALGGQVCGAYGRYFYYDGQADGGYTKEAILDEQQVKLGDDTGQCLDCGYSGLAGDFGTRIQSPIPGGSESPELSSESPAQGGTDDLYAPVGQDGGLGDQQSAQPVCPECGSPTIQIDEVPPTNVVNIAGYQDKKVGKICGKTVPYTRLRHEISCSFEESPWGRWKERHRIEVIKEMFPNIKIGQADSSMRDTGMEVEDVMRRTVGGYQNTAMLGYWGKDRDQYGEVTHWWLTPAMYADYVFPIETQTQSGPIPAGTKAVDIFPDGMHFILVSGCDDPLMLENDCHRDHWVTAPYHLRFLAGTGIGIQDAVEMQRQFNVVLGLIFTQIRTAAVPGWLYDKDTISPDEVRKLGQPQMSVPASLRNKPESTRLEQLVYQMAPGQIPSHIPWYVGQLDANMQTTIGALIDQGVPGEDSKTATGVERMVGAAQQHNAPEFALKGDADVRSAYVMLRLMKKNYKEPRLVMNTGKYGRVGAQWFSAMDMDLSKIRLQAKRDSWLPNTRMDKQEGIEKVLTLTGGIVGLLQLQEAAPDLLEQIEEAYDVTIHGQTYEANEILARQRINQIKQLAPQFEQMTAGMMLQEPIGPTDGVMDPEMVMPALDPTALIAQQIVQAIQPPIIPEEPGHMLSINILREWFVTDEGKEASQLERACVVALIHQHLDSQIVENQVQGMAQMAGQMPMMQQQAAMDADAQNRKTDGDMRKESAKANYKAGPSGEKSAPMKQPRPQKQGGAINAQ